MDGTPSFTCSFGDFRLDTDKRLLLDQDGDTVALMPKAFDTLRYLVEHAGEVVEKDDLMSAVWPDTIVEENNLSQNISVLRKALGERPGDHRYIVTVPGRGFKFVAAVHKDVSTPSNDRRAHIIKDRSGSKIERQSGRIYVLQDWIDRTEADCKPKAVPAVKLAQTASDPTETFEENVLDELPEVGKISPASDAGSGEKTFRRGRLLYWAAIASMAILISAAGIYILRSGSTSDDSISRAEISVTPLTAGDDVQGPTISRDGRLLAYHTVEDTGHRLMLQQVGQLTPIEILPASDLVMHEKTFSPDGLYIYFSAIEKNGTAFSLYRIAAFGGLPRKLLTGIHIHSAISFSPDGSEFAFVRLNRETRETSITIVRADGSSEREIVKTMGDQLWYPAWSPDGNEIAFAHYFTSRNHKDHYVTIDAVNSNGGPARQLVDEKLDNCFRLAWTSGGDGLIFGGTKLGETMTSRRDQVWSVSLSSKKITRISPEGDRYTFGGLTGNNDALVGTVSRTSQVWKMDASGDARTAVQLTRGTTDGRTGIAPLPDGRVGYTTRNGDNWEIWIMNGDGSGAVQAFNDNPTLEEIRVTPDGKYFIFSAKVAGGSHHLFRLGTNGSDLKQLTSGDDFIIGDSSPSYDSSFVIYDQIRFTDDKVSSLSTQRISIDGGGETIPLPGAPPEVTNPHFSPDGKYISFIDQSRRPVRLAIMSTEDTADVRFFDFPYPAQTNVGAVWTPDGRSLLYIVALNKVENIWLQPIDGSPSRQFTNFTSGRIYRLAYSVDGKHIYLARGYATNNALLIKGFVH